MTGFWIFLIIAVLQVVIGAIAKSAEKRKKQEAARLKLEASSSTPSRAAPADRPSPPTAVSTAATAPSGPRQLGLMIREAMGTAGPATGPTTRSAGKTREELLAERQRRIEALRRRQAQAAGRSEPPPPSRKPPAPPVVRAEPSVVPSAAPSAAPPRPTTPTTTPSAPVTPARRASTSRRTTSTATDRIRRLLRQPASVRDAILVAEILREPVALRQQPPGPTA